MPETPHGPAGALEWGDLRHFLELARCGTLLGAARRLGVDHTTVARRLDRLESALGTSLFYRHRRGCTLTEAGVAMLPEAESMEAHALAAREATGSTQEEVEGLVRIGAPEVFGTRMVTPALAELFADHPKLQVELLVLPRFANLARREADISLSLTPASGGRYVAVPMLEISYRLYASRAYLERHAPIRRRTDLNGHRFVDYAHEVVMSEPLRYLEEIAGPVERVFTASGMQAQCEAIQAGIAIGMMTTYAARNAHDLVQLLPREIDVRRELWLSVPADLLRLRRIRVAWDFLRLLGERLETT